jgi:hypothetical protein
MVLLLCMIRLTKFGIKIIDELAFEAGTNRCHKGEVFRL